MKTLGVLQFSLSALQDIQTSKQFERVDHLFTKVYHEKPSLINT